MLCHAYYTPNFAHHLKLNSKYINVERSIHITKRDSNPDGRGYFQDNVIHDRFFGPENNVLFSGLKEKL